MRLAVFSTSVTRACKYRKRSFGVKNAGLEDNRISISEQLNDLQYFAQNNEENILINQEMLGEIKELIESNAEENREMMKDMQNSLTKVTYFVHISDVVGSFRTMNKSILV